jgi:site-specific recombinase
MWVNIALAQHFDNVVSKVVLHVILVVLCLIRFLLFEGLASRVHDLRNSMSAIVIGVLVLLIILGLGVVMGNASLPPTRSVQLLYAGVGCL